MSRHKKKHPHPVPPGNQTTTGPLDKAGEDESAPTTQGAGFQEQDEKRRLGGFETAGEHARVQPTSLNDGGTGNRRG